MWPAQLAHEDSAEPLRKKPLLNARALPSRSRDLTLSARMAHVTSWQVQPSMNKLLVASLEPVGLNTM
jgi:hypothetical protein